MGVAVVVVNGELSINGHLLKVHSPGLSVMFIPFRVGVEGWKPCVASGKCCHSPNWFSAVNMDTESQRPL